MGLWPPVYGWRLTRSSAALWSPSASGEPTKRSDGPMMGTPASLASPRARKASSWPHALRCATQLPSPLLSYSWGHSRPSTLPAGSERARARQRGIVPSEAQSRLTMSSSPKPAAAASCRSAAWRASHPASSALNTPRRRWRTPSSRALSSAVLQCRYGVSKYVSLATSPTESWNAPAPAVRGAADAGPAPTTPAAATRATTAATRRTGGRRLNPFMPSYRSSVLRDRPTIHIAVSGVRKPGSPGVRRAPYPPR